MGKGQDSKKSVKKAPTKTPKEKRSQDFLKSFTDLPIVYIATDKIGQCSARNKGIEIAKSKSRSSQLSLFPSLLCDSTKKP